MAFRDNLRLYKNLQQTTHRKKVIKEGPKPRPEELNDGEPVLRFSKGTLTEYVKYGSKIFEKVYDDGSLKSNDYKLLPDNFSTKPEYDSGWFDIDDEEYKTKTHNLGTKFLIPLIFLREKSTSRIWNLNNIGINQYGTTTGINLYMISDTQVEISTANTNIYAYDNTSLGTGVVYLTDADLRIFLWRINLTDKVHFTE